VGVVQMVIQHAFECCLTFFLRLVMIEWGFGLLLANCVREQTRNPASLAQAGPPCLSESCRVSLWVLVHGSRLGDQEKGLATWSLAQVRGTRISRVARKPESFKREISPRREGLEF